MALSDSGAKSEHTPMLGDVSRGIGTSGPTEDRGSGAAQILLADHQELSMQSCHAMPFLYEAEGGSTSREGAHSEI